MVDSPTEDPDLRFEGGLDTGGEGPWYSVAERHNRLRNAHGCRGSKKSVVESAHGSCWTFKHCDVPLELCVVEGGYWDEASWVNLEARSISKFDYSGVSWDFFSRHRAWKPAKSEQ